MHREEKIVLRQSLNILMWESVRIHSNLKYQRLLLGVNIINNTIWEMNY